MFSALCLAGAIGLCSGGLVAAAAHWVPTHRVALEELGAGLLVAGVALLGLGSAIF